MLTIVTWLWGEKYGVTDVAKLAAGLARNLRQEFRFRCITDNVARFEHRFGIDVWPIDESIKNLLMVKGCFARLKMFDRAWQHEHGIRNDYDRLVCIDLDVVVTGALDGIFDRTETEKFVILQGANAANPCPYNGSLMMLRAGAHPEVWSDFSLEAARRAPFYEYPDDQGWLAYKVPGTAGWQAGPGSGVYAFKKPGWPPGDDLPKDAKLVVFPGWRSPVQFRNLPWIKENWRT